MPGTLTTAAPLWNITSFRGETRVKREKDSALYVRYRTEREVVLR